MGKRNQERRRVKKKQRDARQRSATAPRTGYGDAGSWDYPFDGDPFGSGPTGSDPTGSDPFGAGAGPFADPAGRVPRSRRQSLLETVESIVAVAVDAPDGVVDAVLRSSATELAGAGFGGREGWPGVSQALLGIAARIVHSCWHEGWQPADLVRVVGRDLTARHVRLAVDLVAAEGRQQAAATLDPRWSAQLQELNATVWWDDDRSYLDAVGERERLDRPDVARSVLEVLRLLARLPPIAPVGPPPCHSDQRTRRRTDRPTAPRPGTNAQPGKAAEPRMLVRIRALLAKAESTEFPEEADAFTAMAQQLMARHSISEALLDADAQGEHEPAARRIGIDNPYEAPKALLLDAVTEANRCRSVWSRGFGFSTVVGYEPDLDAVEMLYTSLLVQATSAMNLAGSRRDHHGRSRTRTFRQSFLVAYSSRIRHRLAEATESAVADAAAGIGPDDPAADGTEARSDPRLLPVLAARGDAVKDATERMFPELTSHALSSTDREGWAHGTAAADRAVLHRHRAVAPE